MADYSKQPRRKYCQFCKDQVDYVDYKDTQLLRKYVTDRGKIKPRRVTGACVHARWPSCPTRFPLSAAAVTVAGATKERGPQ